MNYALTYAELPHHIRQAIKDIVSSDTLQSGLRRLHPSRRFSGPVYISRSGSRVREYRDAYAECLGLDSSFVTSHCAEYPITKRAAAAITAANAFWSQVETEAYAELGIPDRRRTRELADAAEIEDSRNPFREVLEALGVEVQS